MQNTTMIHIPLLGSIKGVLLPTGKNVNNQHLIDPLLLFNFFVFFFLIQIFKTSHLNIVGSRKRLRCSESFCIVYEKQENFHHPTYEFCLSYIFLLFFFFFLLKTHCKFLFLERILAYTLCILVFLRCG